MFKSNIFPVLLVAFIGCKAPQSYFHSVRLLETQSTFLVYSSDTLEFKFNPKEFGFELVVKNKTSAPITVFWAETKFVVDEKQKEILVWKGAPVADTKAPAQAEQISPSVSATANLSFADGKKFLIFNDKGKTKLRRHALDWDSKIAAITIYYGLGNKKFQNVFHFKFVSQVRPPTK